MYRKNTLNNIILGNKRKDPVYQAVMTDLALSGAIDIKIAEALLGYEIPDYLKLPVDFEARLKAAMEKEENSDTGEGEPVDGEPVDDEPVDDEPSDDSLEVADDEAGN